MSRSTKKSITIPNPVREGLAHQIQTGILDYPSENAAWIGLARYQLLIGKPHPVTVAIRDQNHGYADKTFTKPMICLNWNTRWAESGSQRGELIRDTIRRLDPDISRGVSVEIIEIVPKNNSDGIELTDHVGVVASIISSNGCIDTSHDTHS